jgi:hypothetical protein
VKKRPGRLTPSPTPLHTTYTPTPHHPIPPTLHITPPHPTLHPTPYHLHSHSTSPHTTPSHPIPPTLHTRHSGPMPLSKALPLFCRNPCLASPGGRLPVSRRTTARFILDSRFRGNDGFGGRGSGETEVFPSTNAQGGSRERRARRTSRAGTRCAVCTSSSLHGEVQHSYRFPGTAPRPASKSF